MTLKQAELAGLYRLYSWISPTEIINSGYYRRMTGSEWTRAEAERIKRGIGRMACVVEHPDTGKLTVAVDWVGRGELTREACGWFLSDTEEE